MHATREIEVAPAEDGRANPESLSCPRCRARVPTAHNFCGFCGHNLIGSLPAQAVGDPLIGAVVGGRYRLMAKIGSGGMGTVYKVEHVQMGKIMAMKLLHGDLSRDESMIRRFNREGRAVSRLASVHTVQVFDYGQSDGLVYLVMEFLRGRDLGHLLGDLGPLDVERCRDFVHQIARSLTEAHVKGVVHRDLKPENIFLCAPQAGQETVKVLDFGLAKLSEREELGGQTLGGSLIGTPFYMSPEQIQGGEVGPRSDVYGFGALIFKLLTGEPPFASKHPMGVLTAHLHDAVPLASERLPERAEDLRRVDHVLQRAMAKDASARYESADALSKAFGEALAAPVASARPAEARASDASWFEPDAIDEPTGAVSTRADWQRYALGLRIRRFVSMFVLMLTAVGASYVVWWGVIEGNFFVNDMEHEPNDRTLDATPLTLGQPIKGAIGLPPSGDRADQDFYVVRYDGPRGRVIHTEVSGVEGVDIVLEAFDMSGKRLAIANNGAAGDSEILRNLQWSGEPIYLLVRELWAEGIPARSAPDVPYSLLSAASPRIQGHEREPNDTPLRADAIASTEERYGAISAPGDVDRFVLPQIPSEGAILRAELSAPKDQDLAIELADGSGTTLHRVDKGRAGGPEVLEMFVAPMGKQPLNLAVALGGSEGRIKASETPYTLKMTLLGLDKVLAPSPPTFSPRPQEDP